MTRVVKEYDDRFNEFLDVAQQLFFRKSYGRTSVQDIIQAVGVAKGTFYHYFDSKGDLLEAVVKRMYEQTLESLEPLFTDPTLSAVHKLEQFFEQIGHWKVTNKALILDTARVLYRDENVLLREKMRDEAVESGAVILADIIRQGVAEGVFDVEHPHETAELVITMPRSFSETLISLLLADRRKADEIEHMERQILVYNRSVERVLGMPANTLNLIDLDDLDTWLED